MPDRYEILLLILSISLIAALLYYQYEHQEPYVPRIKVQPAAKIIYSYDDMMEDDGQGQDW